MKIHTLVSEDYGENTYILETGDNKAVVIDPGAEYPQILSVLQENKLNVEYVLLTHGHYDHTIAAENFNSAIIYAHAEEKDLLAAPAYNLSAYTGRQISVKNINYIEGNEAQVNGMKFYHTPGHTLGCMVILIGDILFSGDTLFYDTVGRTDLPSGDSKKLQNSLKVFDKFDKDITVYPGHGTPFTLRDAYKINYFLK
ncbi:MAG: MBL fold metallo-hydrolase [Candidatus Goldiibacteriota bacterium HGW-Goldbacteria-1]|jgi:glyoxylase-like metal-dependent hydrolase (beta-lactamase superfamily II)|nr:MAG: MBL fold metallo-hydrolase [Candidatus Goldiibacteriota bacterium HGW-Goldbacteria-1]